MRSHESTGDIEPVGATNEILITLMDLHGNEPVAMKEELMKVRLYNGSISRFHGLPVVGTNDCPCVGCSDGVAALIAHIDELAQGIPVEPRRLTVQLWDTDGQIVTLRHCRTTSLRAA